MLSLQYLIRYTYACNTFRSLCLLSCSIRDPSTHLAIHTRPSLPLRLVIVPNSYRQRTLCRAHTHRQGPTGQCTRPVASTRQFACLVGSRACDVNHPTHGRLVNDAPSLRLPPTPATRPLPQARLLVSGRYVDTLRPQKPASSPRPGLGSNVAFAAGSLATRGFLCPLLSWDCHESRACT